MIAAEYADALKVVYEYLVASSTVYGASVLYPVVGTQVYIGALPKNPPLSQCLVVRDGGAIEVKGNAPLEHARIQIDCYGSGDKLESARVVVRKTTYHMHRAKNVRTASGLIVTANRIGGGTEIWTPTEVRPFVPLYFRVSVTP